MWIQTRESSISTGTYVLAIAWECPSTPSGLSGDHFFGVGTAIWYVFDHQPILNNARTSRLGGIVFAKLFQTPAIILNSYEVARELMEKRSDKYSSRPRLIYFVEMYVKNVEQFVRYLLEVNVVLVGWDGTTRSAHYLMGTVSG